MFILFLFFIFEFFLIVSVEVIINIFAPQGESV